MIGDILQPTHLLFVLVVALLVLGPKRLPEAGRALGKGIRDFRSAMGGEEDHQSAIPTATAQAPTPAASPPAASAPAPPAPQPRPEPAPPAPAPSAPEHAPEPTAETHAEPSETAHPVG